MKFNKQMAIILVLLSLLLSAIAGAYYFYNQNQKTLVSNNQTITVYVAANNIKKNIKITNKDLKQINIAKKYVLTTPLLKKEILNKIAKNTIYKNDMFRKEKLSVKIDDGKSDVLTYKNSSYNLGFRLFSNPNYSLQRGEFISIVSVYPKSLKRENMDYDVQYVAKSIKVIGFLERGLSVEKCFRKVKQKVKSKNKKDKTVKYETVTKYADELVLDIDQKIILDLLEDYNKGKQLWMVKTKESKNIVKIKKEIKKEIKKVKSIKKKKIAKKRVYFVKWYEYKNIKTTKRATIHYADTKEVEKSDKIAVKTQIPKQCKDKSQLLIGIAKNVYLRKTPSVRKKYIKKIHKNYLIPYEKKINSSWYKVCDGSFVHKNEVKEISLKNAKKKLLWKQKK